MSPLKKLSEHAQKIGYRTLIFKRYLMPDGSEQEFTTYGWKGSQAAAIIALTPDNEVIIAEQFRAGPERVMAELPGGYVELGEDPEAAVRRELKEETGYEVGEIVYLGTVSRDAYSNSKDHYFIGYNCKKVSGQSLDEAEFIDVKSISIPELILNAKQANMTDSGAILLAYDRLQSML